MNNTVHILKYRWAEERFVSQSSTATITLKTAKNSFPSLSGFLVGVKGLGALVALYVYVFPATEFILRTSKAFFKRSVKAINKMDKKANTEDTIKLIKVTQELHNSLSENVEKLYLLPVIWGSNRIIRLFEDIRGLAAELIITCQKRLPMSDVYSKEELEEMEAYWKQYKEKNPEAYKLLHSEL